MKVPLIFGLLSLLKILSIFLKIFINLNYIISNIIRGQGIVLVNNLQEALDSGA